MSERTISRDDAKILLDRLYLRFLVLDTAWNDLQDLCGVSPESRLGEAVWAVFDGYVRSLEAVLCDDLQSLTWFVWENEFGKKELGHSRPPHKGSAISPVRTIDDFLDVLGYSKPAKTKAKPASPKKTTRSKK